VSKLEKDPKFRKWIVDEVGMKWREYVQSEENVKLASNWYHTYPDP